MASKRYTPLDDPPSASSDDDETEDDEQEIITQKPIHESSSSSEEEEDESEEETAEPVKNPKIQNPNSKPKTLSLNSSSIFEFDSEVRSPTASDFAIKPSKKISAFESPEKTPTSKRPSSGSEIKDKKKIKVSNGDVDDEKKSVIKRVWSVDDELLLLQGFIDYQSKKGCSPLSDMDGFYQFTMSSLPGRASKSQLYEKVRRLKKKFRVNSEKVSGNGEDPVFSKPHERKLFELSSKIWGIDGCENVNVSAAGGSSAKTKVRVSKVKPKPEVKVEVKEKDEDDEKVAKMEDFETMYPYWNAGLTSEVTSALKFPAGVVKLRFLKMRPC
ncbi:hypothetical protein L1987_16895 [Smallanthus sonchifolius]|uniref:Uncharacterized protein n=1 Tax=Smallanthus sonchifolius TaxID=185202 RepID=A0ACB9IWX8_9ASTR|nr:hypothetical protein L1987_16895 [Smallanthus sonchifolius]